MAEEEQDESVEQAGGSKKKLIIMIVGGIVALLFIIATTLFFAGFFDAEKTAEPSDPAKEASLDTVNEDEGEGEGESVREVSYYSLSPSFLVNFQNGQIKVLKVDMTLMATDDKVIDAVTLHNPVIRNNILMMLSNQNPETLKTAEGKLALQAAVKNEVNKVLVDKKITSKVQEVFFTDLVMQ
ncbi:MAG: flagellar basal body-associated FliL family protein [Cycloclasticus sp.]|nr:flagellar basal body-associated FliL family protein [Cycloclasticus sp.]